MGSGSSVNKAAARGGNDNVTPFINEDITQKPKVAKTSFLQKSKNRELKSQAKLFAKIHVKDSGVVSVKQNDYDKSEEVECQKPEANRRLVRLKSQMVPFPGDQTSIVSDGSLQHPHTSSGIKRTGKTRVKKYGSIKTQSLPPVGAEHTKALESKKVSPVIMQDELFSKASLKKASKVSKVNVTNSSPPAIQPQKNQSATRDMPIVKNGQASEVIIEQATKATQKVVQHTPLWLDQIDESMMDEIISTTIAW